jgi:uncharacterized cupin superfamily protein
MSVVVKKIESVEPYSGPHQISGIRFRAVGKALGVEAWGMNVLELDAGCDLYPEHDHEKDGQQEVYVVLVGSATLRTPEGEQHLVVGDMALVAPSVTRKLVPGADGVSLLAIGATPGKAFASSL